MIGKNFFTCVTFPKKTPTLATMARLPNDFFFSSEKKKLRAKHSARCRGEGGALCAAAKTECHRAARGARALATHAKLIAAPFFFAAPTPVPVPSLAPLTPADHSTAFGGTTLSV